MVLFLSHSLSRAIRYISSILNRHYDSIAIILGLPGSDIAFGTAVRGDVLALRSSRDRILHDYESRDTLFVVQSAE